MTNLRETQYYRLWDHEKNMSCPTFVQKGESSVLCDSSEFYIDDCQNNVKCGKCGHVGRLDNFGLWEYNGSLSTVSKSLAYYTWNIPLHINEYHYDGYTAVLDELVQNLERPTVDHVHEFFMEQMSGITSDMIQDMREIVEKLYYNRSGDVDRDYQRFVNHSDFESVAVAFKNAADSLGFDGLWDDLNNAFSDAMHQDLTDSERFDLLPDVFNGTMYLSFDQQDQLLERVAKNGSPFNAYKWLDYVRDNVTYSQILSGWIELWEEKLFEALEDGDFEDQLMDVLECLEQDQNFAGLDSCEFVSDELIVRLATMLPHGSGVDYDWYGTFEEDEIGTAVYKFSNGYHAMNQTGSYVGSFSFDLVLLEGDYNDINDIIEALEIVWTDSPGFKYRLACEASYDPDWQEEEEEDLDQIFNGMSEEEKQNIMEDYLSAIEDYILQGIL